MEQGHQHEKQDNFQGHDDSVRGDFDLEGEEDSEGEDDQKGGEKEPKEAEQRQENNDKETENAFEGVPAVNPPVHDFDNEEGNASEGVPAVSPPIFIPRNIVKVIIADFMDGVLPEEPKIYMDGYPVYYNEVLVSNSGHSYIVRKPLGRGAYGHVVQCQNLTTVEHVAVKILHPNEIQTEKEISKIFSEHNVDLFNIVGVMEIFGYNNKFCVVSELLGVSLLDYCRLIVMPLEWIRSIIQQLIKALMFLKERGIVHGDIKPNNVMFVDSGTQSCRVKLIDFGCAFFENKELSDARLSDLQNLHYRAPESIVKARRLISTAIDMWSMGCVAAELFLSDYMFGGNSEYNQLDLMIRMRGNPPKKMLDKAENRGKYFYCYAKSSMTYYNWIFKSIDSYNEQNPNHQVQPTWHRFDSIEQIRERNLNRNQTEGQLAADRFDRGQFVNLLKRMLMMDPHRRISPEDALEHGFLTMANYNPYRGTAYFWKSKYILDSTLAFYQTLDSSNENRHWRGSGVDLPENIWPIHHLFSINFGFKSLPPEWQKPVWKNQVYDIIMLSSELLVPDCTQSQTKAEHVLHLTEMAVALTQSVRYKFDVPPSARVAIVSVPHLDIRIVFYLQPDSWHAGGALWVPKSIIYPASEVRYQIIPYTNGQPLVTAWPALTTTEENVTDVHVQPA